MADIKTFVTMRESERQTPGNHTTDDGIDFNDLGVMLGPMFGNLRTHRMRGGGYRHTWKPRRTTIDRARECARRMRRHLAARWHGYQFDRAVRRHPVTAYARFKREFVNGTVTLTVEIVCESRTATYSTIIAPSELRYMATIESRNFASWIVERSYRSMHSRFRRPEVARAIVEAVREVRSQ